MRRIAVPAFVLCFSACATRAAPPAADASTQDTGRADSGGAGSDSAGDGTPADTGPADTGAGDSGAGDTSAGDTSPGDTSPGDTSAGGTGAAACAGLPLCDDFEGVAPGGAPDPATWEVVSPDCSGAGTVAIDANVAHSGVQSVRVDGGGGYCDHVFLRNSAALATITGPLYERFYVRFAAPLGASHVTFLAMPDANDGGHPVRMGGQASILMWNRASDDATLPVLSPDGIATSTAPAAGQWYCVEVRVDGAAGTLETWVDGASVAGLQIDGTPTPDIDEAWLGGGNWHPAPTEVDFGWESYAGQSMTLWFDDIALAGAPIGCG